MKAIMISIKPKWVAKILNGEKTIEIRKTMPKCDLPIDVYIYCTKDKSNNKLHKNRNGWFANEMNAIFVNGNPIYDNYNGKVVAKFTLNMVEEIIEDKTIGVPYFNTQSLLERYLCKKSCLTPYDFYDYLQGKKGYAWHISNLKIFDEPKELSEFRKCQLLWNCVPHNCQECPALVKLAKAPQSWCYIEVLL